MDVLSLQRKLRRFAEERDWQQFHSPKNLSMALAAEAGELLEVFQWLTEEQSRHLADAEQDLQRAREELADVVIYALRLADVLGVDLEVAVTAKLRRQRPAVPRRSRPWQRRQVRPEVWLTHVILQPASGPAARQHYANTIERPVALARLQPSWSRPSWSGWDSSTAAPRSRCGASPQANGR